MNAHSLNELCKPKFKNHTYSVIAHDIIEYRSYSGIDYTLNQRLITKWYVDVISAIISGMMLPICIVIRLLMAIMTHYNSSIINVNVNVQILLTAIMSIFIYTSVFLCIHTFAILRTNILTYTKEIVVTDIRILGILLIRRVKQTPVIVRGSHDDIPDEIRMIRKAAVMRQDHA